MSRVLESRGLKRAENETPLEFAATVEMPEALKITQAYNRVRFGEQPLSSDEATEIEKWLNDIEASSK
jgi:hypothetical protein